MKCPTQWKGSGEPSSEKILNDRDWWITSSFGEIKSEEDNSRTHLVVKVTACPPAECEGNSGD